VPEHQLSTERLRHAILNKGLSARPATSWWKLAWTPLAIAGLVFYAVRNTTVAGPDLRASAPPMDVVRDAGSAGVEDRSTPLVKPAPLAASAPAVQPESRPKSFAPAAPAAGRLAMRSAPPGSPRYRGAAGRARSIDLEPSVALSNAEAIELAVIDAAVSSGVEGASRPGIVLIGADKDEETGANRATEVASASNVLVGG
jgi:hypothetical protein